MREDLLYRLRALSKQSYGPASEEKVADFENLHQVQLPDDYRHCMLIANGAPGVFALGEMDDGWERVQWEAEGSFVGSLSRPFPYAAAWNDLTDLPDDEVDAEDPDALAQWEAKRAAFEGRYWGPLDRAFPIAHLGCAIRHWLIVSGPCRGQVWEDGRADYQGVFPLLDSEGIRLRYDQWLLQRLIDKG